MPIQVQTAEAAGGPANAAEPLAAHTHVATLDADGNGLTDTVEGHRHTVKAWQVLESMGHEHGAVQKPELNSEPRRYRAGAFALPTVLADGDPQFDENNLVEGKPVQILKVGEFDHPNSGEFEITEEFLDLLVTNSELIGKRIHFDYEHASEFDSDNPAQTGKAAGWIKKLFRDGDTLWAVPLWTRPAFESISAGEWRYTSAAFTNAYVVEGKNPIGPALTSVAITNHPFLKGMAPIAANERGEYRWLLMAAERKESTMKIELSESILELLGLGAEATPEQAETTLSSKLAENAALSEAKTKLADQVKAAFGTLKQVLSEVLGADVPDGLEEATPEAVAAAVAAAHKGLTIKLTEKGATVPEGMKLIDETTFKEVAKRAEESARKLSQMEADTEIRKLSDARKVWTAEQKKFGRSLYLKDPGQFKEWAATLTENKELRALEGRRSHGQDPDHQYTDDQAEAVKLFSEHVAKIAKEETGGNRHQATRLAEQRHPSLAARYAAATEPAQRSA